MHKLMERKHFLAAAAGTCAMAVAALAARAGTPVPVVATTPFPGYSSPPYPPGYSPRPYRHRGERGSDTDIRHVFRRLETVIDDLQRDAHDYCGHREQAIDFLQRARDQLEAGLACDQQH